MSHKLTAKQTAVLALFVVSSCTPPKSGSNILELCAQLSSAANASTPAQENPGFVQSLWPLPETQITRQSYEDSLTALSPHSRGIGVAVWGDQIGVPLDESARIILQGSCLVVDGEVISNETLLTADGLVTRKVYDANGELLGTFSVGPYYLSWAPPLHAGRHTVVLRIISGGKVVASQAWGFDIVEP